MNPLRAVRISILLLSAGVAAALTGCDAVWLAWHKGSWISPLYREHPLVGRIWKPSEERFVTAGELYGALRDADFALAGEKHNNADHHRYQALLIRETMAQGRQPAIVFEMVTESRQATLDAFLAEHPRHAAGLGKAVGWEESGWPRWRMYRPIAQVALGVGAPLIAGGLDRETTRGIAKQGVDALGTERANRLRLDEPVAETMRAAIREEIHESHCGQLPEQMLDPMVAVTLAKDAAMAEAMIRGRALQGRDAAILIAGGGHARTDWGVPWHLRRLAPGARIVSVGLLEVAGDETDPRAYAAGYEGGFPFDFVWFSPRVDDNDPCEVFADQLRRMREKKQTEAESEAD